MRRFREYRARDRPWVRFRQQDGSADDIDSKEVMR